jgi:hypothetical protein
MFSMKSSSSVRQLKVNILSGIPKFYHLLHGNVSSVKLLYDFLNRRLSAFCDECINFHLVAFRGGCSWSTAVRQIGDVPDASFEVFHPTSHTAGTHAEISIYMTKLINDICSRTVLYEEFNHSMLANYTSLTAILLQWAADKYWCSCAGAGRAVGRIDPSLVMSTKHTINRRCSLLPAPPQYIEKDIFNTTS